MEETKEQSFDVVGNHGIGLKALGDSKNKSAIGSNEKIRILDIKQSSHRFIRFGSLISVDTLVHLSFISQ